MPNPTLSWADLFVNGTLLDLDIGIWDGLVRLIPSDLGIANTSEVKSALTFGHERLVSRSALQAVRDHAYSARKLVDESSIPFKLVPGSRFLPKSQRDKLLDKLSEIKIKFEKAVNDFVEGYQAERSRQHEVLHAALLQASGKTEVAHAAMSRLTSKYPSEDELRHKFFMWWKAYSIAPPQDGTGVDTVSQGDAIRDEIAAMIDKLREQLADKVKSILELAGRGGKITERTYKSAKKLCGKIEALNIFNDQGLSNAVKAVREAISRAADSKDAGETLADGLNTVTRELENSRDAAIAEAADRLAGTGGRRLQL